MAIVDDRYLHSSLTGRILRAAMAVHNQLGNGFPEAIYQRAMAIELADEGLSFEQECSMDVLYKGSLVGVRRVDFLVENKICVELKAQVQLENVHLVQAINYLEAFNLQVGLLISFGSASLEFKRLSNRKYEPNPDTKDLER